VLLLALALPAPADQLVLKGGGRLDGEIEREDERSVVLRMPAGTMTVAKSRIERIVRETEGAYLRREAESRLAAGSTATAVALFERALRDDPAAAEDLARALVAHADSCLGRFRLDLARAAVERLGEVAPAHPELARARARAREQSEKARLLREKADRDLRAGRFRSGLEALHAWSLRQPAGDRAAGRELALAHEAAGAAAIDGGNLRAALDHFRAARSYGARGDVLRALELLAPVAALESLKAGRDEEARRTIASLHAGYPSPGVARYLEAVRDQLRGEMKKAVAGYAEAKRLADGADGRGLSYGVVEAYARAALRHAITKPPREGALRWAETFLDPLESSESGAVTAYAPTAELADEAARAAGAALADCARELGVTLPSTLRAQVVIHANREVYVSADRNPGGTPLGALSVSRENSGGLTYATLDRKGRSLIRVETFAGQKTLMDAVLPHEMVHVAQHGGFPAFRKAHWLDEGLAMLWESAGARERRLAWLRKSGDFFALNELVALRSTPPGRGFLYYNQAYALTAHLRGLGTRQDWRAFLDRMAAADFPGALGDTYGIESLDELERGFLSATGLSR